MYPTTSYCLHQLDTDGTYSRVRSVAVPARSAALALYPNPARDELTITGPAAGTAVQLLNALGQVVLTTTADASGTTRLTLPASLPGGLYLVQSGSDTQRLVVR